MKRERLHSRRCISCNAGLHNNGQTQCWRCRRRCVCPVCKTVVPGKGHSLWCQSCKALSREITAIHAEIADAGEPAAVARGKLIQPVRVRVRQRERGLG